jgi:hypothetical protein
MIIFNGIIEFTTFIVLYEVSKFITKKGFDYIGYKIFNKWVKK